MPSDFDSYPVLEYWSRVREPLFDLLKSIENKVERERRSELEARASGLTTWLLSHLRVARQTYAVIEVLMRDRKEHALPLEASVAIPPLTRVILESVFSIAFVLDEPATRLPWFWKATWANIRREHQEHFADYGGVPEWTDWMTKLAAERDGWRDLLARHGTPLTAAEESGAQKIPYWPNPGKMPVQCNAADTRDLLKYLNARFYGPLSAASHLSGTGLLAQSGMLLPEQPEDTKKKYFSDQVMTAMTLLFVLCSVLVLHVTPEKALAERTGALWKTPRLWDVATEIYRQHLQSRLDQVH